MIRLLAASLLVLAVTAACQDKVRVTIRARTVDAGRVSARTASASAPTSTRRPVAGPDDQVR